MSKLLKDKCVNCNMLAKFKNNIRCTDCNFSVGADGAYAGKKFKLILPRFMDKCYLYYFTYHPHLKWKLPNLPKKDFLGNKQIDYSRWHWSIHHEDGNHWNDHKWNLILLINTEHHYIHMLNSNPMKNPHTLKQHSKVIRKAYKKRYKNGLYLDEKKKKGFMLQEWLCQLQPGKYLIDKILTSQLGYREPWSLRYGIQTIIKKDYLYDCFLEQNGQKWTLIKRR